MLYGVECWEWRNEKQQYMVLRYTSQQEFEELQEKVELGIRIEDEFQG